MMCLSKISILYRVWVSLTAGQNYNALQGFKWDIKIKNGLNIVSYSLFTFNVVNAWFVAMISQVPRAASDNYRLNIVNRCLKNNPLGTVSGMRHILNNLKLNMPLSYWVECLDIRSVGQSIQYINSPDNALNSSRESKWLAKGATFELISEAF